MFAYFMLCVCLCFDVFGAVNLQPSGHAEDTYLIFLSTLLMFSFGFVSFKNVADNGGDLMMKSTLRLCL